MLLCFQNWIVSEKEFEVAKFIAVLQHFWSSVQLATKLSFFLIFRGAPHHGCLYALDWTAGLDYWTDLFASKKPVIRLTTSRVTGYGTLACKTPSLLLPNALLTTGHVKWVGLMCTERYS